MVFKNLALRVVVPRRRGPCPVAGLMRPFVYGGTGCGVAAAFLLGGCAMTGTVQRMGVEYNTAIAGIANSVTLLNIVRAEHDMPLHYTSVSKMTGTVTVKATTSIGQFKNKTNTVTGTHQSA
jgi:hypothetical protein